MKSAMLAALALMVGGLGLAQDPLNPDCPCGPNCPCKAACAAAMAKVQTQEPPRAGHYVTICDGRTCRQVFVPDGPPQAAYSTAPVVALPPPALFYPKGSPQYAVSDDGTVTETRVKFRHRGPVRRFFSRR